MRQDYLQFLQNDCVIIVIGPEDAAAFRAYWTKEHWPFIGLPDPDHTVLDLYGQEVNLFKLGRMPAQMLIDRTGVLRLVHYGHSMVDIPPNSDVLDLLASLGLPSVPGKRA